MAQTISELEKERAELLQAIENQAQQISSNRPEGGQSEHSLNDWLHAAEEVMPANKQPAQSAAAPKTTKNNKAAFFGVIIMLALLLTILGVVYIAYISINKELQKVVTVKEDALKEVSSLKKTVAELQESVAANGQGGLFTQLQNRVEKLEAEMTVMKALQAQVQEIVSEQAKAIETHQATPKMVSSEMLPNNVVTTEILDEKLQEYTHGIDEKLEIILKHLKLSSVSVSKPTSEKATVEESTGAKVSVFTEPEAEIATPEVTEPNVPEVNDAKEPIVTLVKKVQKPVMPEPKAPLINYSSDVKWLMNEPAFNYTLQLASMNERSSVQKMIDDKKLEGARIIPQNRSGKDYFVLVSGSYDSRSDANKAAQQYKSNFGISPWIRKFKDITNKVE